MIDEKYNSNYIGLVLCGGGARGAYEVGVIKYLADKGIVPNLYSGASVGALNAAFLASASSFKVGAGKLETIWRALSNDKMIKLNPKILGLIFLYAAFRNIIGVQTMISFHRRVLTNLNLNSTIKDYLTMILRSPLVSSVEKGLLDNGVLRTLIDDQIGELENGKPLWISMYESQGSLIDLLKMGLGHTNQPYYVHVQELPKGDRVKALLASAALPLAFDSQQIEGKVYRDGGIGDIRNRKGNTPLDPLVQAGCKKVIVVHLENGSLWDREKYKETSIIEVRPDKNLYPEGKLSSLINFNEDKINYLIKLGYDDASRCIGNVTDALTIQKYANNIRCEMSESIKRLSDDSLNDLYEKL